MLENEIKECAGNEKNESSPMKNSRFATLCLFPLATSFTFLAGFFFTAVNPTLPVLQSLYNDTYMKRYNTTLPESTWLTLLTFSTSSLIIGAFIAAMTTKSLLLYVSPRRLLQFLHILNLIGVGVIALGAGLSGSYEAFIIGRLLTGYPIGACFVIVPGMIAEICSQSQQELWQAIFPGTASIGLFAGTALGHPNVLGSSTLWPVLFCVGAIPSIYYLAFSIKIPESPYYLVQKGLVQQAKSTLTKLRDGSEAAIRSDVMKMEKTINDAGATVIGIGQVLRTRQYRNQLIGSLVLCGNVMLCGVNNLLFYSSFIFTQAGMDDETASFATIGIFGLQLIMAFVGAKLVQKFGGVHLLIAANIAVIASLILFTITKALSHVSPAMPYISIAATAIFLAAFSGGLNIATFGVICECTIETTRVTCLMYGTTVLWVTSWFVGYISPYLQVGLGNYSMIPWIVCSILALFYMIVFLPNTKGKSPEQIQRRLSSKVSLRRMKSTQPLEE